VAVGDTGDKSCLSSGVVGIDWEWGILGEGLIPYHDNADACCVDAVWETLVHGRFDTAFY
jgi:hypothetical protein